MIPLLGQLGFLYTPFSEQWTLAAAYSDSVRAWMTQNISFGLFYVSVKTVHKANYIQG